MEQPKESLATLSGSRIKNHPTTAENHSMEGPQKRSKVKALQVNTKGQRSSGELCTFLLSIGSTGASPSRSTWQVLFHPPPAAQSSGVQSLAFLQSNEARLKEKVEILQLTRKSYQQQVPGCRQRFETTSLLLTSSWAV